HSAATSRQCTNNGEVLGREVQWEIVLRVSDWDERQDLRRETKAIQCVQTGARSAEGEPSKHGSARGGADGGTVFGAYAGDGRTAQCRSSAVRWIWSDGRQRLGRLVTGVDS